MANALDRATQEIEKSLNAAKDCFRQGGYEESKFIMQSTLLQALILIAGILWDIRTVVISPSRGEWGDRDESKHKP